jgi:hypothetical protein
MITVCDVIVIGNRSEVIGIFGFSESTKAADEFNIDDAKKATFELEQRINKFLDFTNSSQFTREADKVYYMLGC